MSELLQMVYDALLGHINELQKNRYNTERAIDRLEIDAEIRGVQTSLNVLFQAKQTYSNSLEKTQDVKNLKVDEKIESKGK